jgi:hypothetical protein
MTRDGEIPKLRFAREFSDRDAFEAQSRGYLSHVFVELDGSRLYALFFYDAVRLQQDLEESVKHGRPFIADPGMIVVPDVTLETLRQVVNQLSSEGFFDHLTPFTEDDLASGDPYQWPPVRDSGTVGKDHPGGIEKRHRSRRETKAGNC